MAYITRLSHFRFEKEGSSLVVRSERSGFEEIYNWPDDLELTDEDLHSELHERFYTDAKLKYERRL